MFRLQNNVPEVYVQQSRDFQLFCRLYDSVFSGVKYSIDSLQYSSNTQKCNSELLDLLKTKLGLFIDVNLSDTELRYVLQAFPSIIRYKGSLRSIDQIIALFQRISHNNSTVISIQNKRTLAQDQKIILQSESRIKNDQLLFQLLSYVLPTGYFIDYTVAEQRDNVSTIYVEDTLEIKKTSHTENSIVIDEDEQLHELQATVGLTEVANMKDLD